MSKKKIVTGDELKNMFSYQFDSWTGRSGFEPTALLATHDNAGCYEKSELHVFRLKRGYAIVHESGCSCYEASGADIDIKEKLSDVRESLRNASKDTYSYGDLARNCLAQMIGITR